MLLMAKNPPADAAALKALPGLSGEQVERRGREILAAVGRGLEVPDRDLPRLERPPRRPADPALEARVERLKAIRNALAKRYDLPPGVLCPNGILEAIARANPTNLEEMSAISGLRRWQLRELGDELLAGLPQPAAP